MMVVCPRHQMTTCSVTATRSHRSKGPVTGDAIAAIFMSQVRLAHPSLRDRRSRWNSPAAASWSRSIRGLPWREVLMVSCANASRVRAVAIGRRSRRRRPRRRVLEQRAHVHVTAGGRGCASLRSPRASWHQPRSSCPSTVRPPTSSLLHPGEDGPMRLQIDQAPGARDRRMIRGRRRAGQPQKTPDRQRVRRAPGDAAFRVDALEVADQQQAEVAPSRQARATHHRRVEAVTQALHEPIEVVPVEQRRQPRRRTDGPAMWAGPTSRPTTAVDRFRECP